MSWASFASILTFIFAVFFIVLVVLGCLIILAAVLIGAGKGFRALRQPRPERLKPPA